jgi:hypothetical protein
MYGWAGNIASGVRRIPNACLLSNLHTGNSRHSRKDLAFGDMVLIAVPHGIGSAVAVLLEPGHQLLVPQSWQADPSHV